MGAQFPVCTGQEHNKLQRQLWFGHNMAELLVQNLEALQPSIQWAHFLRVLVTGVLKGL
jgi:hypothetical protein